jgi:hypothetical protein
MYLLRIFVLVLFAVTSAFAQKGGSHSSGSHSSASSKPKSSKSKTNRNEVKVKGYTRKNGTKVSPSYRTAPNRTEKDNYSAKGNVNPHTSKVGTKEPKK